jgi:hypothetical protein
VRRARRGHALKRRYGRAHVAGIRFISRRKLGEKMSPWGGDFAYGRGTGAVGAVSSFYFSDKVYPDKGIVEEALAEANKLEPQARAGLNGWTKNDATQLRNIVGGLRYYLKNDY